MSKLRDLGDLSDDSLREWLQITHRFTGISIAESRKSMVQGRLRKRIVELNLASYEEYFRLVVSSAAEKVIFIDLITTNETYFYRTPRIWDYVEKKFLPNWHISHPSKTLQAWSAAASSGEEAHTIGTILQHFKSTRSDFSYQVFGTDISQKMVQTCQQGTYSGKAIESFQKLRPELFQKYLASNGDGTYSALPEIRARIKFKTHNLFQTLPNQSPFDLILLRNVLIYFKPEDQEAVLKQAALQLAADGILILGESESLTHIRTDFKPIEPLIYTKNSHIQAPQKAAS